MNQEVFTEAMINAEAAFSNENYALALEWFRKALEENPDDLQALSRAGTVCVPLDKYDDAFEYFQRAMELNPENGDNAFNLGNAYFFHGDYGKALALYAEAEMKGVSDDARPRLFYQMALLCSVRQDVKAALANFQKYEDSDKSGTASLNPDVISEKIKLYMMAEDYGNAAKSAVQWIAIDPTNLSSYMVYFSILMAQRAYERAELVLDDAKKYAELDEDTQYAIEVERVALFVAKADVDSTNAEANLQSAYDLITTLKENAPVAKRDELTLTLAEVCMKMNRYQDAISAAESLLPSDTLPDRKVVHKEPSFEQLDESEIESLVAEDMQAIEEKIASGEIDESIVDAAEVYYDEDGNPVRQYPEGAFDEPITTAVQSDDATESSASTVTEEKSADYYDRLYFILLSCYAAIEDYKNARKYGGMLKHSENVYYAYFGRYTEAFSMKKLSETTQEVSVEDAEKQYAEAIAFYRSMMLKNPKNNFAVIFRARMYAESGKFIKAEEMASLLALDEKEAVMAYIEECRKEIQSA